jgi:hypothetical protein
MPDHVFDDFLDELRARLAIEDALKRFMRGIDRMDWALARSTYHDDAVDEHGFFRGAPDAFLAVVARAHERQDHSMHFVSNIQVEFVARRAALVETYVLVFQRFLPGPEAPEGVRKIATARYVDRFEEREREWKVAWRTVVFGDVQSEPLTGPFAFPPGFTEQRHGTDDFLYAARARMARGE